MNRGKKQEENKEQPIFVEFYNLHLSDSINDEKREKITRFLKKYAPATVERGRFLSLKWYEYETGISWFESKHFSNFVNEYQHVKKVVDGYLSSRLSVTSFQWLKEQIEQWKPTLRVVEPAGNHYFPSCWKREINLTQCGGIGAVMADLLEGEEEIDLTQCRITTKPYSYTVSHDIRELPRYGIAIDFLLADIYWQLALLLEEKKDIRRCAAGATPKMPACQNIFIPQREEHKYCSDSCRMRIYQSKRREELKRQDEERLAQARASLREYRRSL